MKKTANLILLILILLLSVNVFSQEIQILEYKHIDTIRLKLELYYPAGFDSQKSYPVIIYFFGGGWNTGNRQHLQPFAAYYVKKGFITVLADYRTRSKHGTTPFESLKDAKSAIRYLREHAEEFSINPDCIIASGGSAGGHLATACFTNTSINESTDDLNISPEPNALILLNPVIDTGEKGFGYRQLGDRWKAFSPIHNIRKGFPPCIIFLGTKDDLIPVSTAELFKQKVEDVGGSCKLVLFPGEVHGFFNKAKYRKKILPKMDDFLKRVRCSN